MAYKYPWQEQEEKRKKTLKEVKPRPMRTGPVKRSATNKSRKPLPKKSKKLSTEERIYSVLRKDFLADHPVCQCGREGCKGVATQVHHKRGRGKWLNVVEFFLAVCWSCHEWIEGNPKEARRMKFSLPRIGKL